MKPITFPCMDVQMVPIEKVISNDYNPNHVAGPEMKLLQHSIQEYGFTYPLVVCFDAVSDLYIVVDGFHRYTLLRDRFQCTEVPVIVIADDIKMLMAATICFNRARGKHQVELMSNLVARLVTLGWEDTEIARHLGMEAEEIIRLKQMTGLAGLFKNQSYSRAWIRPDGGEEEVPDARL